MSVQDPMYYWDYLGLDEVLGAQRLASSSHGREPAHDELLFIITHQAFELWFKQVLWELDAAIDTLGRDPVPEAAMGQAVRNLERIVAIQPLLVQQFRVLATMTPLDFLDFRDELIPASGFQSVQWRLIENRLGLARAIRLKIKGATKPRGSPASTPSSWTLPRPVTPCSTRWTGGWHGPRSRCVTRCRSGTRPDLEGRQSAQRRRAVAGPASVGRGAWPPAGPAGVRVPVKCR